MLKKQTSVDWEAELLAPDGKVIIDPAGWDRTNFDESFHKEKITRAEFERRVANSTCIGFVTSVSVVRNG